MADRTGIELARVGEFDLSTGKQKFTPAMLADAAARASAADFRAPVKLGHTDPRNDGEPAFGWLANVRVEGEGDDAVLLGDITGMPQWLADTSPSAYPDRSIEGNVITASDGSTGLEITGLALLGVTPPGIGTLKSWRDLPAALAASSSELPLTAFAAAYTAIKDAPQTPAEPPADPSTPPKKEADTMSDTIIKGLRERLGVKPDVELDEAGLLAALDESLAEKADPPAATPPAELTPEAIAAAAAKDGKVLVSADVLEELKISAKAGAEARAVQLRDERDGAIAAAIRAGKIAPARKDHWTTKWDADPEGAKADLDSIEAGLLPVAASGYGGDADQAAAVITEAEADELAGYFGTEKGAFL